MPLACLAPGAYIGSYRLHATMHQTRRSFLKSLGAGATAAVIGCRDLPDPNDVAASAAEPARIALQLYTLRDAMETDPAGTLRRVAEMGYTWVETAFFPDGMTSAQAGQLLRDAGLNVCSAHVEIPAGEHRDALLATAEAFDCTHMVWHGWPEDSRYQSLDGIRRIADTYNEAHAFARANGLQFGLHNHWWEFESMPETEEGRRVWQDIYQENLPNEWGGLPFFLLRPLLEPNIFFEIDTYWTRVAGLDPASVVREFGSRAQLLHIKDGLVLSADGPMVPAGQGLQDFAAVAEAGAGNTAWMVVELDNCECDMFTAAAESYAFLTENGLARS